MELLFKEVVINLSNHMKKLISGVKRQKILLTITSNLL